MIKLVAFDFDGTLADTMKMTFSAFGSVMAPYRGAAPTRDEITATFGRDEPGMIHLLVKNPEDEEKAFCEYMAYFESYFDEFVIPHHGLRELIAQLRRKGIKTGIVTGRCEQATRLALKRMGMDHLFDRIFPGHPERNIKTECMRRLMEELNVTPQESLYVGDIVSDVLNSRDAGMRCISAAWDQTADLSALEKVNPGMVCRTTEEAKNKILSML